MHVEYLKAGTTESRVLAGDDLETISQEVVESAGEMAEYLLDGDIARNEPLPKDEWEMVAEDHVCKQGRFFELCLPEMQ